MITPVQAARLQEGDTILARSGVATERFFGDAWARHQDIPDRNTFERVQFSSYKRRPDRVLVHRQGDRWVMSPEDCKIIPKRGRNKWGEKAEVGMEVIIRNGEGTRRSYGEPEPLARELRLVGTVMNVSGNGNPYVLVHGLGHFWFSHSDWREEANVLGNLNPFEEGAAPAKPKPPEPKPVKYEDMAEKCRKVLAKSLRDGLPSKVTLAAVWEGKEVSSQITICHAFLREYHDRAAPKYLAMYNYPNIAPASGGALADIQIDGPTEERVSTLIASKEPRDRAYVEYIKFLCEDEVFSQAWVNPVLDDVLLYGFECDMSCPQVIAMTAYTASRLHYEYRYRLEFWWELVQLGVHPRVALVMQAFCNRGYGGKYKLWSNTHGHQVFDSGDITVKGIRALRDNKLPKMSKKMGKPITYGYSRYNEYFDGEGRKFWAIVQERPEFVEKIERKCSLTGNVRVQHDYKEFELPELARVVAKICEEVL